MILDDETKLAYVRTHIPRRINAVNHLVEYGRWHVRGDEGQCVLPWYEEPRPVAFVTEPFCTEGLVSSKVLLEFLGFGAPCENPAREHTLPEPKGDGITVADLCGHALGAEDLRQSFDVRAETMSQACARTLALAERCVSSIQPLDPFKTWKRDYFLCALTVLRLFRDHVDPVLGKMGRVSLRPTLYAHIPMLTRYASTATP